MTRERPRLTPANETLAGVSRLPLATALAYEKPMEQDTTTKTRSSVVVDRSTEEGLMKLLQADSR